MNTRTLDVALRIAADLDGAVKDVAQLDTALDGLKGAGQSAAQGLNAAATASGKNSAANQGNATAAKAASTAQAALGAATQKTSAIQQRAAMTAGELRNAQRQLPMQITDIVTGLASGQSVFMVAIQQGGQLKDSFGGVAPAARALLGAISPAVLAVSAGAAAFGVMGLAMYEGYQEMRAYERGLISTGGIAGVTAGQVRDMASEVGAATGQFGAASTAMQALAASGKLSGDSLQQAAGAAVNLSKLTGESTEATTDKIIKLAEAPSAMLVKLNDDYHFLTATVYEHVRSLEDQGRAEDAAAAAVEAFARVHEQRVQEAEERAGVLERTWRGLGTTISAIWAQLKNVGRDDLDYQIDQLETQIIRMNDYRRSGRGAATAEAKEGILVLQQQLAVLKQRRDGERQVAEEKAKGQRADEARLAIDRQLESIDKRAQKQRELNELQQKYLTIAIADPFDDRLTDGSRERLEAAIEKKYEERKAKARKAGKTEAQKAEEAAQREIASLREQAAMLGLVEDGERQVSFEAKARYEIEKGAFRLSSEKSQQELLAAAQAADAARKRREEEDKQKKAFEESKRAYDRLADTLRTPVETAVDAITEQIKTLNDAIAKGVPQALTYQDAIARIFDQSYNKAPVFHSPYAGQDDQTGLLGDQAQLDSYLQKLNAWYAQQQAIISAGRASNAALSAQWDAQEERVQAEHAARLQALTQAQHQMQLVATASIFDSMAQIAYNAAGEQSRAYQVLFAISKGFAVAQAAVALAQNVAEASKVGFPQNLPLIAAAFAQGAQIAAILSGANFRPAGYATGGYTGPGGKYEPAGIVHRGEGVLSQEDIRALGGPGGFHALRGAIHNGFAEGGMVMPSEMPDPIARITAGTAGTSATPQFNLRNINLIDSAELVGGYLDSPDSDTTFLNKIARNSASIRQVLGG